MLPVLKNAKHEAVLQAFLADKKRIGWRAYKKVYRKSSQHASETAFSRLLKNAEFAARLGELTGAAAAVVAVSASRVFDELAKIAFANMQDYMRPDADGDPVLDFSALTRDQAAALSEVTVETFKENGGKDAREVRRVKFKLHDKRGALVDLGKHFGLFTPKPLGGDDNKNKGDDRPVSDLEAARRIAFLLAKAAQPAGVAAKPPSKKG